MKAKVTSPVTVLQRAKALIVRFGWTQQVYMDADGRYCADGALRAVGCSADLEDEARRYLERTIKAPCSVAWWNDRLSRRKGQVLAKFDEAIELAKLERRRGR